MIGPGLGPYALIIPLADHFAQLFPHRHYITLLLVPSTPGIAHSFADSWEGRRELTIPARAFSYNQGVFSMPKQVSIDTDIWSSSRISSYDPRQLSLFFYLTTNPSITESGIYKISPSDLYLRKNFGTQTLESFLGLLESISDNILYDYETKHVFVIEHLAHTGLRRGNPRWVAKSIINNMKASQNTILWQSFVERYQTFAEPFNKLSRTFSDRLSQLASFASEVDISQPVTESQPDQTPCPKDLTTTTTTQNLSGTFLERLQKGYVVVVVEGNKDRDRVLGEGEGEEGDSERFSPAPQSPPEAFLANHPEVRHSFLAFLESRRQAGGAVTNDAAIALAKDLFRYAGNNPALAINILQYSRDNGYRKLFPAQSNSSVPIAPPKPQTVKANLERLIPKTTFNSIDSALAQFRQEAPPNLDPSQELPELLTWLSNFHIHNPKQIRSMLAAAKLNPKDIDRILKLRPDLTVASLIPIIGPEAPDKSPQAILASLTGFDQQPKPNPGTPRTKRTKTSATNHNDNQLPPPEPKLHSITRTEYYQLPAAQRSHYQPAGNGYTRKA